MNTVTNDLMEHIITDCKVLDGRYLVHGITSNGKDEWFLWFISLDVDKAFKEDTYLKNDVRVHRMLAVNKAINTVQQVQEYVFEDIDILESEGNYQDLKINLENFTKNEFFHNRLRLIGNENFILNKFQNEFQKATRNFKNELVFYGLSEDSVKLQELIKSLIPHAVQDDPNLMKMNFDPNDLINGLKDIDWEVLKTYIKVITQVYSDNYLRNRLKVNISIDNLSLEEFIAAQIAGIKSSFKR